MQSITEFKYYAKGRLIEKKYYSFDSLETFRNTISTWFYDDQVNQLIYQHVKIDSNSRQLEEDILFQLDSFGKETTGVDRKDNSRIALKYDEFSNNIGFDEFDRKGKLISSIKKKIKYRKTHTPHTD